MRIDAHHHIWTLARGDYDWLTPNAGPLYRDRTPADLRPLLDAAGIDATILVQAAATEQETRYMLDCAHRYGWIAGVVGWTDLAAADAPDRIATLAADRTLVGFRPMLQDMTERDWIGREEQAPALAAMADLGLVLDALIRPDQIAVVARVADRFPKLVIVVDHAAKPPVGRDISAWAEAIGDLAKRPNVYVKISGLMTEAPADADADADVLRPVTAAVLAAFGTRRVLWGSDWPVVTRIAGYADWLALSETLLADLVPADRTAIFGGTAAVVYGITR